MVSKSPHRKKPIDERNMNRAISARKMGATYRDAAKKYGVNPATLFRRVNYSKRTRGKRRALRDDEEQLIVSFLLRYATRGIPLTQENLCEAVQIVIGGMPPSRRILLPFNYEKPGVAFLRSFRHRHADKLSFAKPLRQEAKQFAAVNGEVITSHFATIEKLIEEHALDAGRIFNLDECGTTPEKDLTGVNSARRLMPRRGSRDMRMVQFKYLQRVTLMPVISASRECGPPLFVFKGERFPYRTVIRGGSVIQETPTSALPRKTTLALRRETGGVDKTNFLNWAYSFIDYVQDLTANGRKVLLIYDGYRSHLSLEVLELFHLNNIVLYALPAHTSGKTQPLDLALFSVFKDSLNSVMSNCTLLEDCTPLTLFHLCALLTRAYEKSFTLGNIRAGFFRSGIWPFNPSKLLSTERPADSHPEADILSVEELEMLYEEKRKHFRNTVLGEGAVMMDNGFVDTTNGCVMNSAKVLQLVKEKRRMDLLKRELEEKKRQQRENNAERKQIAAAKFSQRVRDDRMRRLAKMAKRPLAEFLLGMRGLAERRAAARIRTRRKHGNGF